MRSLVQGVPAGTEKGLLALLDLIANPSQIPTARALLTELLQARDDGAASLTEANTLNAEMLHRGKELEAREALVKREEERLIAWDRQLERDQLKHQAAVTTFQNESAERTRDLSARSVGVASAEQAIAGKEHSLRARESAIEAREKAAMALKAEYDTKLAGLKKLAGVE
jgi:hypothetical protein